MTARIDLAITAHFQHAFRLCGFDPALALVRASDRDDADFQCDAAIRIGKMSGIAGATVAERVIAALPSRDTIEAAWSVECHRDLTR